MNRISSLIVGMGALLSVCACSTPSAVKTNLLREPESARGKYDAIEAKSESYKAFKAKVKAFSAKLSQEFAKRYLVDNANLACSPISIEMCLGLAVRCADGATRQELLDAFGVDYPTFNQYYGLLYEELYRDMVNESKEPLAQLLLTNSIWFDDDVKLLDAGLDGLKDDYYCYSYETDFSSKEANEAIRKFIDEKTNHLINPSLDFDASTLFVLMNTLYLKELWKDGGYDLPLAEGDYKFTNSDGKISSKKLLKGNYFSGKAKIEEDYSCFYTRTSKGVDLTFIKPSEGKSTKDVLTVAAIENAMDKSSYVAVDHEKKEVYTTACIFPEFKAECDQEITPLLKENFKINAVFSNSCDFSNITEKRVLCSEVRHIAKLNVDKKGVEGAAVTFMAFSTASAGDPNYKQICEEFIVDRDFGFLVTYQDTILFSGIVNTID